MTESGGKPSRRREASIVHALVVIFLEYSSWGLLTVPVINVSQQNEPRCQFNCAHLSSMFKVLAETFPANKFLMNGIILGLKVNYTMDCGVEILILQIQGILSFLSAPLIGHYSDMCGRKKFLLLTVLCTCLPIPCLKVSPWWYFTLFTLSGIFSVTFTGGRRSWDFEDGFLICSGPRLRGRHHRAPR